METSPSQTIRLLLIFLWLPVLAIWARPLLAQNQMPQVNGGAIAATVPPAPFFVVSSPVIQPSGGKLPASMPIAIFESDCDPTNPEKNKRDLSTDYLVITGSGLSVPAQAQQKARPCAIQATLTIDPNTPAGSYSVIVDDANGNPVGHAEISVLGASAGAIPPGLSPGADVIWDVMAQNNCSDAFGRRVASSFYCVQLKIGNNSGYGLQIAGVGFAKSLKALEALGIPSVTIANTSYATTRAVLVHAQAISPRNIAFDTIAGAGLIMTAATPFYASTFPQAYQFQAAKNRFLTFSSIVNGPLQSAFNVLFPDPIVDQLKSLDDQSFHGDSVIPNNSQIQTVVFVEKQNVTTALREIQIELNNSECESREAGRQTKKSEGVDQGAISGQSPKTPHKAQTSPALNDPGTGSECGQRARNSDHPPDVSSSAVNTRTLNALAKSADGSAVNSTRPKGFHSWNPLKPRPDGDPLLVKLALGNLVIVGDHIQYLDRVQIQSGTPGSVTPITVTIMPKPPPAAAHGSLTPIPFTAVVANDPAKAGVAWTLMLSGSPCLAATCGTSTQSADTLTYNYLAPVSAPVPNTVTLKATSLSDGSKLDTVTITIN